MVGFIWRMCVIVTGSMRFCRGSVAVRSSCGTESWTTVAMVRRRMVVVVRDVVREKTKVGFDVRRFINMVQ